MWECKNKKVSIIVPVYNREEKIEKCINSIQRQTYKNIEIICVDDGSKDNSREVVKRIKENDARVILIEKENGGPSSARNRGLMVSTGEYIQFVDSDDSIDADMVERLVKSLEEHEAQLVICGYKFSDGQQPRIPENGVWTKTEFLNKFHEFYEGGFIHAPWNKLYVKNYIQDYFPEDMDLGEDCVFNMIYISNVSKVCVEECAPYLCTTGDRSSLSARYNRNAFYCEEKKNQTVLECLEREGIIEGTEVLKKEFAEDFRRCLDREVCYGGYSRAAVEEYIYEQLTRPFWCKVFFGASIIDKKKEQLIKRKIKYYVIKMLFYKQYGMVKQSIKKLGMLRTGECND